MLIDKMSLYWQYETTVLHSYLLMYFTVALNSSLHKVDQRKSVQSTEQRPHTHTLLYIDQMCL